MFPRSPGPSSTVSGLPVSATGSPGRMPDVSSYTWTTVLSPRIWMTSPMSCSVPTSTTSYMRGRSPIAVTTGPATRSMAPVPLMSSRAPLVPAATQPPHLNRSTPIARFTLVRRSSSSAAPTPMTTGRATVSSRRRIEWLSPFMSAVSRTRIPTSGSSRISASFRSISSFVVATVRRTPTSLNPWTKSSRPTAAISISHHQELSEDVRGKPALLPAAHEGGLVQLHHLLKVLHAHLTAARQEDLPLERRLRGPHPKERLQVHDIDLPLDELPHEAVRLRRRRDRGEELRVVDRGDAILPGGPVRHVGRLRPEAGQGLRIDRVLEPPEHPVERLRFDQLAEEREGEAPGGHEVLLDFRRRCAVRLRPDDRLHVLQVVSVQVAADDGPQIALAEIVDLVVHLREVPRGRRLDEVHARVAAPEREHLRLVLPFAEEPRDLGDLHLQEPSVDVLGQEGRPLRPDPRRDVRIVARLVRDPLPDPAVPLEERFEALDLRRPSPHALEGHRVSATSLTASSHTSLRIDSYRRAIRRLPSALSITTPPAQSIVPANAEPAIFRTTGSSRAFAYTLPPPHSASLALRTPRRNSA